jgi:hypothetical protein
MNVSLKTAMAVGFILAAPLFAVPALGAPPRELEHKSSRYQTADFANAQAFVTPPMPILRALETDGLSRNDEECNVGCLDH